MQDGSLVVVVVVVVVIASVDTNINQHLTALYSTFVTATCQIAASHTSPPLSSFLSAPDVCFGVVVVVFFNSSSSSSLFHALFLP